MSDWEPKVGDIVTLKSEPDHPMTVAGFDKNAKLYGCVWLGKEGEPHAFNVAPGALQKFDPKPEVDAEQLVGALTVAQEEIARLQGELTNAVALGQNAGRQYATVVQGLRKIVPQEAWTTEVAIMVQEAVRRHETMRGEANAQIERLAARVKELGG